MNCPVVAGEDADANHAKSHQSDCDHGATAYAHLAKKEGTAKDEGAGNKHCCVEDAGGGLADDAIRWACGAEVADFVVEGGVNRRVLCFSGDDAHEDDDAGE